jgi:hypothetical protein
VVCRERSWEHRCIFLITDEPIYSTGGDLHHD